MHGDQPARRYACGVLRKEVFGVPVSRLVFLNILVAPISGTSASAS